MPVYDFCCKNEHHYEVRCKVAERGNTWNCPDCQEAGKQIHIAVPAMPTTIVVDYPGSKRLKAGYVHSHGNHSASKTQFGYGGKQAPKEVTHPMAKMAKPEPFHFRKFK